MRVFQENAETGSETNESMDTGYLADGRVSRVTTPQSNDSSFSVALQSAQSSGRPDAMQSNSHSRVTDSWIARSNEQYGRDNAGDRPGSAASRSQSKHSVPDLLRNAVDVTKLPVRVESGGPMKVDPMLNGGTKREDANGGDANEYQFRTGFVNTTKGMSRASQMSQELLSKTCTREESYNRTQAEVTRQWLNLSREAKYGMMEGIPDYLVRGNKYDAQSSETDVSRSNTAKTALPYGSNLSSRDYHDRSSAVPFAGLFLGNAAQLRLPVDHFNVKTDMPDLTLRDETKSGKRSEVAPGSAQIMRPEQVHSLTKRVCLASSDGYYNYQMSGRESVDRLSRSSASVALAMSAGSFIPQSSKLDQTFERRPSPADETGVTRHAIKQEIITDDEREKEFLGQFREDNFRRKKDFVAHIPESRVFERAENKMNICKPSDSQPDVLTGKSGSRPVEKLTSLAVQCEGSKFGSQPMMSPDGNKLPSPDADKTDSLYRRRVKNLMLKQTGDSAKIIEGEVALNSPRLGVHFNIPASNSSQSEVRAAEDKVESKSVPKSSANQECHTSVPTAYCETGSPRQTRPQTSFPEIGTKSSDVTANCTTKLNMLENGHSMGACGMRACHLQSAQHFDGNAFNCHVAVCCQSGVNHCAKTNALSAAESRDFETAIDCRAYCNQQPINSCASLGNGHVLVDAAADAEVKCCSGLQSMASRCHAGQYQVGCGKMLSHPNTPVCGDKVYLSTRHVGCCSISQAGTPSYISAGKCSCIGVGSDFGMMECAHGQRTPVVLHCPQVVACPEQIVRSGCCPTTFIVPPSPCEHRQQAVIQVHTPCMAHTPCTPRDAYCQRSCRAMLTPASAIAKQACHFQFPPCTGLSCDNVRQSPFTPHGTCAPCRSSCASPVHGGYTCTTPHCNRQHVTSDRGYQRQTCVSISTFFPFYHFQVYKLDLSWKTTPSNS